ncbi:MAG: M23 family metallopeptidase [Myxococcota bacterium]
MSSIIPSIPSIPPHRPRRPFGLILVATALGTCGLAVLLVPAAGAPALADDRPAARMAVRPLAGAATGVALDGSLAAAAARAWAAAREAEDASPDAILRTAPPEGWLTTRRGPCRRYGGRIYCDGPLKVAKPHGEAAALAERLGLGTLDTASHLLRDPPEPRWVEAVEGEPQRSLRWPVEGGNLWRGYGRVRRRGGGHRLHKGVDIGAEPGTPVVSVNDALVAYAHNEVKGYGNLIMLVHADGTTSMYAHLKAAYVFPGQQVRRGQVIGEVGHTGLARGPHLHFEWRRRAYPRDPVRRFAAVPEDQLERLPRHALARR